VRVEHNYGFNAWNGREWSHNWSAHFNPYSSRPFDHTDVARFGAYNGNFHAHVPEAPATPRAFDPHNVYSGRDGHVYRYNPSGNWERNTGQSCSARRKPHELSLNNTPSAATWANNGSTTSVRLAAGFRTPPAGLPMVAEGAPVTWFA